MEGNTRTGSSGVAPPLLRSGVQPHVPNGRNHVMAVIVINAGEGIGEKIQSYFENRENFPSWLKEHTCLGVILLGQGTILSPTVQAQGSVSSYEGLYDMAILSGQYSIPKDGHVHLHGGLKICFANSNDKLFGGSVVGSLIAAEPIQVTVLIFIHDDTEWRRLA